MHLRWRWIWGAAALVLLGLLLALSAPEYMAARRARPDSPPAGEAGPAHAEEREEMDLAPGPPAPPPFSRMPGGREADRAGPEGRGLFAVFAAIGGDPLTTKMKGASKGIAPPPVKA